MPKGLNHNCCVCGKPHRVCLSCKKLENWRASCDTIDCYQVLTVITDFNAGNISKQDARNLLDSLLRDEMYPYDNNAKSLIDKIYELDPVIEVAEPESVYGIPACEKISEQAVETVEPEIVKEIAIEYIPEIAIYTPVELMSPPIEYVAPQVEITCTDSKIFDNESITVAEVTDAIMEQPDVVINDSNLIPELNKTTYIPDELNAIVDEPLYADGIIPMDNETDD